MPAGQSCPPHPDLRSSWILSGSSRRPEKSTSVVPASLYSGSGARSVPKASGENSGDGDLSLLSIAKLLPRDKVEEGLMATVGFRKIFCEVSLETVGLRLPAPIAAAPAHQGLDASTESTFNC